MSNKDKVIQCLWICKYRNFMFISCVVTVMSKRVEIEVNMEIMQVFG